VIPNEGTDAEFPVWNWDHAKRSNGVFSAKELQLHGYQPSSIFRDSKGCVYEVCNGRIEIGDSWDTPPDAWPNSVNSSSRLLKWNAEGDLEWSVGVHTDDANPPPGAFSEIRGVLGEVRDCLVVLDARAPARVWTRDGLYAGSFLDGRVEDGLPEHAYQRIMRADHQWGQVFETPTGEIIWGAMGFQSTPYFRIHGWDGWERQTGKIEIRETPRTARHEGQGLKVEYHDNPNFAGKPVIQDTDPDIWFGPLWGDHRHIPARKIRTNRSVLDLNNGSARWTGFIEGPVTENFVFNVYTYGEKNVGSKVRLWIDSELVIDDWSVKEGKTDNWIRTRTCTSPPVRLHAGELVPIKLEYAGAGGKDAHLHLYWKSPSFDLRHVPKTLLYPERPAGR
jgi:hypothetical protein